MGAWARQNYKVDLVHQCRTVILQAGLPFSKGVVFCANSSCSKDVVHFLVLINDSACWKLMKCHTPTSYMNCKGNIGWQLTLPFRIAAKFTVIFQQNSPKLGLPLDPSKGHEIVGSEKPDKRWFFPLLLPPKTSTKIILQFDSCGHCGVSMVFCQNNPPPQKKNTKMPQILGKHFFFQPYKNPGIWGQTKILTAGGGGRNLPFS